MITDRWTYPDALRVRMVTPLTHLILTRLAHAYGFVSMPPMPPQPRYREQGARGVHQVLSTLRSSREGDAPIIGIAPEGRDSPDGSLIAPPSGTGRFPVHMPVGIAEVDGVLTASYGPPFALGGWSEVDERERDLRASTRLMARCRSAITTMPVGGIQGRGRTDPARARSDLLAEQQLHCGFVAQ